jgi:hypothetical protein
MPEPERNKMLRDLVRRPLEQLLALLWLVGMVNLAGRLLADQLSLGMAPTALLAGMLAVYFIAHYRRPELFFLPVLCGLAAVLAMLKGFGAGFAGLMLAQSVYALAAWRFVDYAEGRGWLSKAFDFLNIEPENASDFDYAKLADISYRASVLMLAIGVGGQLAGSALLTGRGEHSPMLLSTLLCAMLFFRSGGHTGKPVLRSYLVIGFAALAVMELVSLSLHPFSFADFGSDALSGPFLILMSIGMCSLATVLSPHAGDVNGERRAGRRIYAHSLRTSAILLAVTSVWLQSLQLNLSAALLIRPSDVLVPALAALALLWANRRSRFPGIDLAAFLFAVQSLLALDYLILHPGAGFSLWPGVQRFPDIWFAMALASLIYAVSATSALGVSAAAISYRKPLKHAGALCWAWAMLGSLALLPSLGSAGSGLYPWLYLTLFLALFPLSEDRDSGGLFRDIGGSILFALAFLCAWELNPYAPPLWIGLLALGFLLWMAAGWVVPAFSRSFPAWGFKPASWPWLGLLSVLTAFPIASLRAPNLCVYFLALAAYGLLMPRYSRLGIFAWLPGASFTLAGIMAGALSDKLLWVFSQKPDFAFVAASPIRGLFPLAFTVNTLAWANFQWLIVIIGREKGNGFARKLQWRRQDFAKAFESGALLILNGWLSLYAVWILAAFWRSPHAESIALHPDNWLVGLLLMLSFLHALRSQFSELRLHGLLSALFLTLAGAYPAYGSSLVSPPMALALWCLLLAFSAALCPLHRGELRQPIEKALSAWIRLSLALATLSLLSYPFEDRGERLLSLLLIALITGFQGVRMRRANWFYLAFIELLAVLHLWPFLLLDAAQGAALLPWYALQLYVLAGLFALGSRFLERRPADENGPMAMYRPAISLRPMLTALALAELAAHGLTAAYRLQQGQEFFWLSPVWDPLAVIAAGLIQCAIGIRRVRKAPDSMTAYGLVLLIAALGGYIRLLIAGAAPVTLWDTSLLIVFAYTLFFVQRLFPSRPLLNMAMLMPLAALATVPMQLKSPEASATLMATGLLYLLIRRYSHQRLPAYLALLAFNVGLYLWIPGIVRQSHLVQIYVIPAALTLLMLLQLHRRELKPSVMMSTRLAAASSIYACAALDVFLLPDLKVFVLALGLSLAGVVLGIALRIRAFLYAGIAFMLLNVFGQLIRFYPDQALGKAAVLMGAGMAILGAMIWFNLKKIQIMQRIDLIRVELEAWE